VSSAGEWIVYRDHVAGFDNDIAQGRSHSHGHRAEMHRHVISLRDDATGRIKHGAGIIASLFDVWRERSAP
jgi:hypothetical protein